jgi:23S rRNA (cytosine1962-C5)-methyltransferase
VEQADMLANRLRKKKRLHGRWLRQQHTTAYRLYDRDIPELPFAIDAYGDRLHGAVYARKEPIDPVWARWVIARAGEVLGYPADALFIKVRERQKGLRQYERFGRQEERLVVQEHGHRFWVNLSDYLDTGLFLDHRETRRQVEHAAAGARFLNLFAYTGSFGVYAAAGGAEQIVQVDLSRTYLDWAKDNLQLNEVRPSRYRLVQADSFAFLREAAHRGERYDLVVVDPPTFSNSKRMAHTFDVKRDHPALLEAVAAVLAPGGTVWFSTNARHFSLSAEGLPFGSIEDMTDATRAPDFAERHSHRAFRLRQMDGRLPR